MSESSNILSIHSIVEGRLYLRVRPCGGCGDGPLVADDGNMSHDAEGGVLAVPVTCRACGGADEVRFDTGGLELPESVISRWFKEGFDAVINPTDEASRVIDVADWLTLYSVMETDAQAVTDRKEARKFHIAAARCIDEALKFFDLDNDLPPADAFFGESSRRQFRDRPEIFTRQHLVDLRNKLPVKRVGEGGTGSEGGLGKPKKRRWLPWG